MPFVFLSFVPVVASCLFCFLLLFLCLFLFFSCSSPRCWLLLLFLLVLVFLSFFLPRPVSPRVASLSQLSALVRVNPRLPFSSSPRYRGPSRKPVSVLIRVSPR